MRCPVCYENHISLAPDLLANRDVFTACPDCTKKIRNKAVPPDTSPIEVCRCGRVSLDDVFASLYNILVEMGIFSGNEPLSAVGTPLVDPGMFLRSIPYLPPRTLLLISSVFDSESAGRAYREVSQISGILLDARTRPGIEDLSTDQIPSWSEHVLLCGCDVRADLFPTSAGPVVVYKKQGSAHIEFPHGIDPKIRSVETAIRKVRPQTFVDACSGSGTLGLAAMRLGIEHTLMNDPWYAAAFFSGFNLLINKQILGLDECVFPDTFLTLSREQVQNEPLLVAEGYGPERTVEVYQGRMEYLPSVIDEPSVLTVFDPFDKPRFINNQSFLSFWQGTVGGEVFIP